MRSRNIKPGFFKNEELAELPMAARILFQGLWCLADRAGRLEDRPKRIKAEILPYDDCDVDELLSALHEAGFIIRYQHGQDRYVQVTNFEKHQHPNVKETESTIPAPCSHDANTEPAPKEHRANTPEYLIPHTENPIPEDIADASAPAVEKPAKTLRVDQAMYEAFKSEYGYEPGNDVERGRWNTANKLVRDAKALPEDVPRLHAAYRHKYPHASDTVMAMAGHAGELLAEARVSLNGDDRGDNWTGSAGMKRVKA